MKIIYYQFFTEREIHKLNNIKANKKIYYDKKVRKEKKEYELKNESCELILTFKDYVEKEWKTENGISFLKLSNYSKLPIRLIEEFLKHGVKEDKYTESELQEIMEKLKIFLVNEGYYTT